MNATITKFLNGIRDLRKVRSSSSSETYWRAVEALASGKRPDAKANDIAEAMERLNKSEADLEADVRTAGEMKQAQAVAAKEPAAVQRHKAAVGAKASADQKAAALETEAKKLRAEAEVAVVEAGRELGGVRKARAKVAELSRVLAKAGHPAHVQNVQDTTRQLDIARRQNDLAAVDRDLATAQEALAAVDPTTFAGGTGKAKLEHRVWMLQRQRDRMAAEIETLRNGGVIDEGEDVSDQLLADEVTS